MLQATGSSYFAFEPFLALQRNQPLPLADHITRPPANAGNACALILLQAVNSHIMQS